MQKSAKYYFGMFKDFGNIPNSKKSKGEKKEQKMAGGGELVRGEGTEF